MFENLQKREDEKVDDIFAESDKVDEGKPLIPNSPPENAVKTTPTPIQGKAMPSNSLPGQEEGLPKKQDLGGSDFDDFEDNGSRSGKVLKKLFVVIIILAIVGLIAYFVYSKILLPKAFDFDAELSGGDVSLDLGPDVSIGDEFNEDDFIDDNIIDDDFENGIGGEDEFGYGDMPEVINGEVIDPDEMAMDLLRNVDSDGDGISDYDEIYVYGTDPYNPDSDFDGLSDFDEIYIFGTDPLNPDTDGDGYLDGEEVAAGYNPLGEGRLDLSTILDLELFAERYPELYAELINQ